MTHSTRPLRASGVSQTLNTDQCPGGLVANDDHPPHNSAHEAGGGNFNKEPQ
jgi:hypothetical protein